MRTRRTASVALPALSALAAILLVAWAPAALAHVTATPTAAGQATTVTFSFTHGCEGQPTTSLRVQLPPGTTGVQAAETPGWTSSVSDAELQWSGGSIPDGTRGQFTATMTLVGSAGETVYLPTLQGCPSAEEAWIDKTPDPEATNAAPRVVLQATVAAPETTTTAAPTTAAPTSAAPTTAPGTTRPAPAPVPAAAADEPPSAAILLGAGAALLVVIVVGGLLLRRRQS